MKFGWKSANEYIARGVIQSDGSRLYDFEGRLGTRSQVIEWVRGAVMARTKDDGGDGKEWLRKAMRPPKPLTKEDEAVGRAIKRMR